MSALWFDTVCVNWRAAGTISSFTGNTLGSQSPLNVIWHQEWKEQQATISLVEVWRSGLSFWDMLVNLISMLLFGLFIKKKSIQTFHDIPGQWIIVGGCV